MRLRRSPVERAVIFTNVGDEDPFKKSVLKTIPIGPMTTADNVADFVELLVIAAASFFTGERVLLTGGSRN